MYTRFIIFVLALSCLSCEEIPPQINPIGEGQEPTDTLVSNQSRQVLIEEFTGVKCVNCPAGSEALATLLEFYGARLIPVSIHAGFFSSPYPESRYDLQTPAGDALLDYLGQPQGYPTAVIDRRLFPGENSLQLIQRNWAGYIADELSEEPLLRIGLERTYQPADRELAVTVTLLAEEDLPDEDVRLTVLLTEEEVRDFQLTPAGKKGDYVHRHVLRTALTPATGLPIDTPQAGSRVERTLRTSLPPGWQAENCHVVAFVSVNQDRKDVLQAHRVPVVRN